MRTSLAAVVLSVLVLAACGSGDTDVSVGNGVDGASAGFITCDLLTASEAAQWLGEGVAPPSKSENPQASAEETCVYRNEANGANVLVQARFGAKYYGGIDPVANEDPVAIAGLGDDAYLDRGRVAFQAGDWAVSVSRIGGDVPDASLEEMARTVEPRLP